jgi:hypothetical protein
MHFGRLPAADGLSAGLAEVPPPHAGGLGWVSAAGAGMGEPLARAFSTPHLCKKNASSKISGE